MYTNACFFYPIHGRKSYDKGNPKPWIGVPIDKSATYRSSWQALQALKQNWLVVGLNPSENMSSSIGMI